jgi:hypothetical protein
VWVTCSVKSRDSGMCYICLVSGEPSKRIRATSNLRSESIYLLCDTFFVQIFKTIINIKEQRSFKGKGQ